MIRCFFHNLTIHHFTAIVWSRATRSNILIRLVDESSRMIQSYTKSNTLLRSEQSSLFETETTTYLFILVPYVPDASIHLSSQVDHLQPTIYLPDLSLRLLVPFFLVLELYTVAYTLHNPP